MANEAVATVRDLETAVGRILEIEIRGGRLEITSPASYPGKAAVPPVLSVSSSTVYVDFRFEYAESAFPPGANESTVRLFNATNTSAPVPVTNALVNRNANTIAANVTSAPGEPLATGRRVDLVALAEFSPVANVTVTGLRAPATVTRGERLNVSATVRNDGSLQTTVTPEYRVNGSTVATGGAVILPGGRSTTVTFNLSGTDTESFPTGTVSHGVFTANASATASLTVESASTEPSGPSPLVGSTAPTDPDGDGRYEDITGDGQFNVLDVAEFLDRFGAVPGEEVQFFDFSGDGQINILDVAELLGET